MNSGHAAVASAIERWADPSPDTAVTAYELAATAGAFSANKVSDTAQIASNGYANKLLGYRGWI